MQLKHYHSLTRLRHVDSTFAVTPFYQESYGFFGTIICCKFVFYRFVKLRCIVSREDKWSVWSPFDLSGCVSSTTVHHSPISIFVYFYDCLLVLRASAYRPRTNWLSSPIVWHLTSLGLASFQRTKRECRVGKIRWWQLLREHLVHAGFTNALFLICMSDAIHRLICESNVDVLAVIESCLRVVSGNSDILRAVLMVSLRCTYLGQLGFVVGWGLVHQIVFLYLDECSLF